MIYVVNEQNIDSFPRLFLNRPQSDTSIVAALPAEAATAQSRLYSV
jgi:hypothetical protein